MNEGALTRKIMRTLKNKGVLCFKIHGGPHGHRGLPDIIGLIANSKKYRTGRFFGIEVKMPGRENTLTELQEHKLSQIKAARGITGVVTTPQEALAVLGIE